MELGTHQVDSEAISIEGGTVDAEKRISRWRYNQIICGFTSAAFLDSKIYIKHFSECDFASFEEEYQQFHREGLDKGLEEEADKLKLIINDGHWSVLEESEGDALKESLKIAQNQRKQIPPNQVGYQSITRGIQEMEDQLYAWEKSRDELVGLTASKYAQRKNNERIIFHSFYKDKELKEKFFTEEAFNDMGRDDLYESITVYNRQLEGISEESIKKISVLPFFLNAFFLSNDDPRLFYGDAIINLTIYQQDLFSKGKYMKSILTESEADGPPDALYEMGLQAVINWYDKEHSMIMGKRAADRAKHRAAQARAGEKPLTQYSRPDRAKQKKVSR